MKESHDIFIFCLLWYSFLIVISIFKRFCLKREVKFLKNSKNPWNNSAHCSPHSYLFISKFWIQERNVSFGKSSLLLVRERRVVATRSWWWQPSVWSPSPWPSAQPRRCGPSTASRKAPSFSSERYWSDLFLVFRVIKTRIRSPDVLRCCCPTGWRAPGEPLGGQSQEAGCRRPRQLHHHQRGPIPDGVQPSGRWRWTVQWDPLTGVEWRWIRSEVKYYLSKVWTHTSDLMCFIFMTI